MVTHLQRLLVSGLSLSELLLLQFIEGHEFHGALRVFAILELAAPVQRRGRGAVLLGGALDVGEVELDDLGRSDGPLVVGRGRKEAL